ncbi:MAG: SurA N-terminal domain-containing protein [Pasteurellaceae bacterium]|nr:SurA N-terminal domain-containing protein [Pasteurellaceae bacterium]
MIEKMHDKTGSLGFKIIFALVSLSFVLGGIGGGFLLPDSSAVKVNGEEISQHAFTIQKNRQQNVMNQQLGERFWDLLDDPDYLKQYHDSILNSLIDDELLRQYAKELKLGISADQIKAEIVNSPMFQKDGKFDNALYQQLLRSNALSADQYAGIVYEGMLFAQIQDGIINSDFNLPVQQELLAKLLLQKRTARLATYSIADEMANQTAADDELQRYYEKHKTQFINPEKLTVEYVSITPKDVSDKIQITPEQIQTYYETNKAQFVTKGESKIAHIQVADEGTAKALEQQLKDGADFATLAKEKSTDTLSAQQGGELGWAKAGNFPAAFEQAFANLEAGQISPVVKVDNAFHIIKVLDRKAETAIPLEQVKDNISAIIRKELAATDYSTLAREMANKAFENNTSLAPVAEVANLAVQTTEAFSRENIPAVLNHEKVLKALFDGELKQNGQNSDAIDLTNGDDLQTMFVRVSQYQAQSTQTFEQAKSAVETLVKREKAEQALTTKAEQEIKALQAGNAQNVNFADAQTFEFAQAQIAQPVLAETLFAMPKPADKPQYQVAKDQTGNVIIIALEKVEDGSADDFNALAPQFAQADRLALRQALLQDLRQRAKIEINEEFLNLINHENQ